MAKTTAAIATRLPGRSEVDAYERHIFDNWFAATALIVTRYRAIEGEDDPFAYNETAGVSALAGAAALAGYIGLAEYGTQKRARTHPASGNSKESMLQRGRGDFYLADPNYGWEIEFRCLFPSAASSSFEVKMQQAIDNAQTLAVGPSVSPMAGLIVSLFYFDNNEDRVRLKERGREFAKQCDHAWLVEIPGTSVQTMFFFKAVKPDVD